MHPSNTTKQKYDVQNIIEKYRRSPRLDPGDIAIHIHSRTPDSKYSITEINGSNIDGIKYGFLVINGKLSIPIHKVKYIVDKTYGYIYINSSSRQ